MTEQVFSEELKRQTQLSWDYIEKAKSLITYMKLVPVSEQQIAEYEESFNKIVPPDYRYWLTTYGSGRIEFLKGSVLIPSIYDLAIEYGPIHYKDAPVDFEKRVYIIFDVRGPLSEEVALDSTVVDENGCAPAISIDGYSDELKGVLASSWPMYLISQIVGTANQLKLDGDEYLNEQKISIDELLWKPFDTIDQELKAAKERVHKHSKTRSGEVDDQIELKWNYVKKLFPSNKWKGLFPDLLSKTSVLMGRDDDLRLRMGDLEKEISLGYATLHFPHKYFEKNLGLRHEKRLRQLLVHERREIREFAWDTLKKICPAEAEKDAERYWDWATCAKMWATLQKSNKDVVRCLNEAEQMSMGSTEWRDCAELWRELLSQNDEARRCLLLAEGLVEHEDYPLNMNLIFLAKEWVELGDLEKVRSLLLRAEETSNEKGDSHELVFVSQIWRESFNDLEASKRCLKKAEPLIGKGWGNYDFVLKEWEKVGDQEEMKSFKLRNADNLH